MLRRLTGLVILLALVTAACTETPEVTASTLPSGPMTTTTERGVSVTPATTATTTTPPPTTTTTPPPTTTTTAPPTTTTTVSTTTTTTAPTTTTTTPPPTTTTTTAPTTTTTTLPPFVGGTGLVVGDRVGGIGLLTATRMASHGNFDRFVFEFRDDGRPAYSIGYVEPPFINIPGSIVGVAGNAFLGVHMPGATTVDWEASTDQIVVTYDGPARIRGDTDNITEVVFVTDFESDMEWLIGLAEKAPFKVMTLDDPNRIVVDVGHGSVSADEVATQWVSGGGTGFGWLTDARLAGHEGYDRFALEFSPDYISDAGAAGVPAFDVHYVAGLFSACGDLTPVTIAGDVFILVEVNPASAFDWSLDPPFVFYDGPGRLQSGTANVTEAVLVNDCLGLQWVIGLDHEAPITVSLRDGPPRLVIDIGS